jgi:hypothetical protein
MAKAEPMVDSINEIKVMLQQKQCSKHWKLRESRESQEIPPCGTPGTLEPHNFASRPRIEVQSEAKL